jgi:hypothetical protein
MEIAGVLSPCLCFEKKQQNAEYKMKKTSNIQYQLANEYWDGIGFDV